MAATRPLHRVADFRRLGAAGTDGHRRSTAELHVPGGARPAQDHGWHGVYFSSSREILNLSDGTWLTAMTANFEEDTLAPTDRQSALESKYQNRSIVVSSTDEGARGATVRR